LDFLFTYMSAERQHLKKKGMLLPVLFYRFLVHVHTFAVDSHDYR